MSEMITKNHALIAEFGDSLDRLLDGIENFMANSRPTLGAGLPQQRHNRLLPVGRQDSIQGIGHRKYACRQLSGGVQIG